MKRTGFIQRKTPLANRTALVRKAGPRPRAAEARVHKAIREAGCERCGGEAEIHHILHAPETGNQRHHELVVALCPRCHRSPYPGSVHTLGSEAAFFAMHGVDLLAAARRNRAAYFAKEAA